MGTENHVASRGWLEFKRRNNGLNQYGEWYSIIHHDDHFEPNEPGKTNGVLMMEGWIGASFNALNQPVAMYSGSTPPGQFLWFGYDPLGRCVKRWLAPDSGEAPEPEGGYAPGAQNPVATYLYYDGWNLVQEGTAPNSPTRLYVHGGRVDEVVAQIKPENNQLRYFQYDARGHCAFQTDTSGQIMEQYEYDAFGLPYFFDDQGNPTTTANGQPGSLWGNRILFTGREYLSDMRIYDFRHRVYHPELGRFLQPDPIQFKAGDYNLYRYCQNDPVNKSDPTGLLPIRDDFIGPLQLGDSRYPAAYDTDGDGAISGREWGAGVEGSDPALQSPPIDPIDLLSGGIAALFRNSVRAIGTTSAKSAPVVVKDHALRRFPEGMRGAISDAIKKDLAEKGVPAVGKDVQRIIKVGGKDYTYRAHTYAPGKTSAGTSDVGKFKRDITKKP